MTDRVIARLVPKTRRSAALREERARRIAALLAEKTRLLEELCRLGDLRRGSISVQFRRCGKERCACARAGHPGHGPQILLVHPGPGRRWRSRSLRPGPEFRAVTEQVETYRRFRRLVAEFVALNEAICALRRP